MSETTKPVAANDLDLVAVWQINGNGMDGPGLAKVDPVALSSRNPQDGYWIVAVDTDVRHEYAIEHLAEAVRGTTSGVSGDEAGWKKVTALAAGFCEAFGLSAVPSDRLPEPLRSASKVLVLTSRQNPVF